MFRLKCAWPKMTNLEQWTQEFLPHTHTRNYATWWDNLHQTNQFLLGPWSDPNFKTNNPLNLICPPEPFHPRQRNVIFLSMSCHSALSLKDCYPEAPSHFHVFSGCFFPAWRDPGYTDWLPSLLWGKAPGSIPIMPRSVGGTDKNGQQVFTRLSFIIELLCPYMLHTLFLSAVIQKEPRSTQTHTWDKTVWLVPGSVPFCSCNLDFPVLSWSCLFSTLFQGSACWRFLIQISFNVHLLQSLISVYYKQ